MLNCKKTESDFTKKSTQNFTISVAAAANLRDVLEELKQIYMKENPDKKVEITFGSSGLLVQQILNGAPFDLFLSADSSFPDKLKSKNKTSGNSEIYTFGKVALWSSKANVSKGLKLILNPEIKKNRYRQSRSCTLWKKYGRSFEKNGNLFSN
ncbi:molybdate ABC transporter substrate-binding protein [Chryseobacterium indoltheticum]|uniref:molybdate ABC transporter substrate-binding protein n=1 Tax=Chryseobacterium indoltheticum TaxID=254 RepID=UPI003F490BDD